MGAPHASRRSRINWALGKGFGEERFTGPSNSGRAIRNSIVLYKIYFMNPGNKLGSRAAGATEAKPHQAKQLREDSTGVGTHDHGGSQRQLAHSRSCGGKESFLPFFGDFDAEAPARRRTNFARAAAEFSGFFVHGTIEGVAINCGGAGIHPDRGRRGQLSQRAAQDLGGKDARIHDGVPVGCRCSGSSRCGLARFIRMSAPSSSEIHAPSVEPSQRTTLHGAGTTLRERTATRSPRERKWRARRVPTWPLPPAITTRRDAAPAWTMIYLLPAATILRM